MEEKGREMSPKKILLVDDESDYTDMLSVSLEQFAGYTVRTENDATKVAQVAYEFQPDLILLDIMMPEMDGGEVAALLSEQPGTKTIPVAFLSAMVMPTDAAKGPLRRYYFSKTMSATKLIESIEKILADAPPTEPA